VNNLLAFSSIYLADSSSFLGFNCIVIRLYLARHGETTENVAGILQGHLPGRLTPTGKRQAEALRDHLLAGGIKFDALLVSDLQRTLDTAQIINAALHLPLTPLPLLRERDWGSLTGVPISEARAADFPADVESVEKMFARARALLTHIEEHYRGQTLLAIGHGLFNRCILAALSGCTIREIPRMANAEVRCVAFDSLPANWATGDDLVSAD